MTHFLLIIIYFAFISLGLPDALLGSAWPNMVQEFQVPLSYAGLISIIISICTVISSLQSDVVAKRFGTGKATAISTLISAIALFGFTCSHSFWMLLLWAIPYGLGAGCIDACLNNYVAIHYASRHMSWLHCMWGIGASSGPIMMGLVLTNHYTWNYGYFIIACLQFFLSLILFLSLPKWQQNQNDHKETQTLSLLDTFKIKKARFIIILFFCYCAIEQTAGLWASSYFTIEKGMNPHIAATLGGFFFVGIAFGRFLSGFLTYKFGDKQMIELGFGIMLSGIICMLLPFTFTSYLSFILVGLGCAPIYPSLMHSITSHFDTSISQSIFGIASASANAGVLLMPPLFGIIANHISISLLPYYFIVLFIVMIFIHHSLWKKTEH